MEVPRVGSSYKIQTQNKNGLSSQNPKEYLTEKVTPFLKKMKNMKKDVKIIHCDNSGKNKTFEENSAKTFEEINFELISPGTPQKVCVVEPEFATLYSQIHAMMAHVGLHENLKTGI